MPPFVCLERLSLAPGEGDGAEAHPMFGAGSEPGQRLGMGGHAIALVLGKAIAGPVLIEGNHQPVTRRLGENGGRRYARDLAIALDDGLRRARHNRGIIAVYLDETGRK